MVSRNTIIVLISLILSIACAVAFSACSPPTGQFIDIQPVSTEPVKIGVILPLSGEAAGEGVPVLSALRLAASERTIHGRAIELVVEDGQCTPKGGAVAAQKLITVDQVDVIIGGSCSGETLGAAPIAEQHHAILFSPGSASPDITNAGEYVFRNIPSDALSASKVAQAAIARGHTRVAVLSEAADWPAGLRRVFIAEYTQLGGTVVFDDIYVSGEQDFLTTLTKLRATKPDAIYIAPQTSVVFARLMEQMREQQIVFPVYGTEAASVESVRSSAEGVIFAQPVFDERELHTAQMLRSYEREFGTLPNTLPPYYLATAYDALNIIADALEACGETTNCVQQHLYHTQNYLGTSGRITFDKNGDIIADYKLKQIRDGALISIAEAAS